MAQTDITAKEDLQALSQQTDAIDRATADLKAATARGRSMRLALLVATVLLVGVVVVSFYRLGTRIQDPRYTSAVLELTRKRVNANSDKYRAQFDRLVDNAGPPLREAFNEQAKKDLPEFMKKLEKEKDTLAANLEEKFSKKINDHYEKLTAQQEKTLKEVFPGVNDPKTQELMLKNIDQAMQKLVKKYHVDEMRKHIDDIVATWDHFPEAASPKAGELSLEDQLIQKLLQVLSLKLSGGGLMTVANTPAPNTPKTPVTKTPKTSQ
jgi:hypothetical protein